MTDKEKIKSMTPEEVQQKTIEILNEREKARFFYAGIAAAMRTMSIRPEDFADECRADA